MTTTVDYYFATISPFGYLGHDRFVAMASKHRATVNVKPINLGEVLPVSGGLPLAKRAPQRQAYRLVELARWADFLGKPMHVQPRFFPVNGDQAAYRILAVTGAISRALWEQERDIADAATLTAIVTECGLPADQLASRSAAPDIAARYAALTQEAIGRGVFGAPTYVVADELFWGQDRLDFVERKLAK